MTLALEPPSPEEQAAGIATRFEYRDDNNGYTARGVVKRSDRGLTIASLEVISDSGDLSGSLLRDIPLGTLLRHIRSSIPGPVAETLLPELTSHARRGGRAPLTDEHLCQVATAYLKETAPGMPPAAVKRMAEQFKRPEETVRTWIAKARATGWLGPGAKGRVGAEPGPRLLAAQTQESAV